MSTSVLTSLISAVSIIAGSLLGALCSYIISSKLYKRQNNDEILRIEENRKYEEKFKLKKICDNANIIRLDISTAIFERIRSIQNNEENKKFLYLLPINKDYSSAVASLNDNFNLKELSVIYQLYGIIEKVNRDIYNWKLGDEEAYKNVQVGFLSILFKIYGDNYKKLMLVDTNTVSYDELYKNNLINSSYKEVLLKLDDLCVIENLLS